jgi:hypothetical protein
MMRAYSIHASPAIILDFVRTRGINVNQPFYALSRKSLTVQVGIRSLRFAVRNVSPSA